MTHFDILWEESHPTAISKLQGVFEVKILTGCFRFLCATCSVWQKEIEGNTGWNLQDNKLDGYFTLWQDASHVLFDYDQPQNTGLWTRLQDHVRQTSRNYFIGKIYLKIRGKYRFMGYFSLLRIETEKEVSKGENCD